ncbi:MAG: hypothetical protein U1C57_01855 [Candidatus Doudnabacteria bacterium]|nr:hypothetical protein [bacterium]MDZ4243828.1 hypothetical protein [Candidatus Doudnabacteria bacterium]
MPTCPMCNDEVDDVEAHKGETHPESQPEGAGSETETPSQS